MALTLDDIHMLLDRYDDITYNGGSVTQLEYTLWMMTLAEAVGMSDVLVTVALLHNLDHLLNLQGETPTAYGIDDQRQHSALSFLCATLPDAVLEPIRLHVDAKRCLCVMDTHYYARLSADSVYSLMLQGGVFSTHETETFIQCPYTADVL